MTRLAAKLRLLTLVVKQIAPSPGSLAEDPRDWGIKVTIIKQMRRQEIGVGG